MKQTFLSYFFSYLFHSKTRQKLIFIATGGLFLSSFALIILHSVMGGLQEGLIGRSKKVEGEFELQLFSSNPELESKLFKKLEESQVEYFPEYEIELLAKSQSRITPIILHGVDTSKKLAPFLETKDLKGLVLGADLGAKLQSDFFSKVSLISTSHTDSMLGDIPRQVGSTVTDFYLSELVEIDLYHAWVRLSLVQNLIREKVINRVRFYHEDDLSRVKKIVQELDPENLNLLLWSEKHQALMWSLNLETTVMILLFISMTFLISITITAGFMIFFDKIKRDLASFWILGASKKQIMKLARVFCSLVSFLTCLSGLGAGLIALSFLEKYSSHIMPDVFMERNLPVNITWEGIVISVLIPYVISLTFGLFSLSHFKKENHSFLEIVRNVG